MQFKVFFEILFYFAVYIKVYLFIVKTLNFLFTSLSRSRYTFLSLIYLSFYLLFLSLSVSVPLYLSPSNFYIRGYNGELDHLLYFSHNHSIKLSSRTHQMQFKVFFWKCLFFIVYTKGCLFIAKISNLLLYIFLALCIRFSFIYLSFYLLWLSPLSVSLCLCPSLFLSFKFLYWWIQC